MARSRKQLAAAPIGGVGATSDPPTISRMKMGESGWSGLRVCNKVILEERRIELRFPYANYTYKLMAEDATIFSALQLFEMMLSRIDWHVTTPANASPELLKRAEFLEQCMHDMDQTWLSFVKEICSVFTYGYCVNEKIYRRRYTSNGSRYNDGYVGIKKLPVRSQDTISGWLFSDDRRELIGLEQDTTLFDNNSYYKFTSDGSTKIKIPRDKFLLFRIDPKRESPVGRSPLNGCYVAWKYRMELEEQEAIATVRGIGGIPVIRMASRYMSADATPDEQAVYAHYQQIGRNLQNNEQATVILPSEYDPDTKQRLFDITLMGVDGNHGVDTSRVISR